MITKNKPRATHGRMLIHRQISVSTLDKLSENHNYALSVLSQFRISESIKSVTDCGFDFTEVKAFHLRIAFIHRRKKVAVRTAHDSARSNLPFTF